MFYLLNHVAPRKRRVSRNANIGEQPVYNREVAPRKRRVSRNIFLIVPMYICLVAPRKRRVSRNDAWNLADDYADVAPRKRRVSRNMIVLFRLWRPFCRASQEARE